MNTDVAESIYVWPGYLQEAMKVSRASRLQVFLSTRTRGMVSRVVARSGSEHVAGIGPGF